MLKRKFGNIVKIAVGDHTQFTLEHRLFNMMILLLSLLGFLGAYHNMVLGLNPYTIYPSVAGGFLGIYFYYLARIKGKYRERYVYALIFSAVIIISVVFFNNSGSAGPIIILHLCLFNIFVIISNGRNQIIILLILLLNVCSLYFVEYKFENWISHYSSGTERFWDVLVTFFYSTIFMIGSTIIFKRNYNREKSKADTQNIELQKLNDEIKEKNLVLESQTRELEKSITEVKDKNDFINSLLKELNHRVKNNLQLVSSLLNMQESNLKNKDEKGSINLAKNRITAISLIHQKLYSGDSNLNIHLNDYIKELCSYLIQTEDSEVDVEFDIRPKDLYTNVETTVHIGLIVNELITNSLKHAWINSNILKSIIIKTSIKQKNKLTIQVFDNGVGFDKKEISGKNTSFGLQLINSIIEQYNGSIQITSKNGANIEVSMFIDLVSK